MPSIGLILCALSSVRKPGYLNISGFRFLSFFPKALDNIFNGFLPLRIYLFLCLSAMAQKLVNALKGRAMDRKSGSTPGAFFLSRVWPLMSWLLQQLLCAHRKIHFCISYHFPDSFRWENSYATRYTITAGSRNHLQKYFYFQQLFLVL